MLHATRRTCYKTFTFWAATKHKPHLDLTTGMSDINKHIFMEAQLCTFFFPLISQTEDSSKGNRNVKVQCWNPGFLSVSIC